MHSRHRLCAAVALTAAFFLALATGLHAAWIPLKAELAQWLIERSWREMRTDGSASPPWPWADTRPAAKLALPDHGVELVVLAGNSGRNLAFGPVFLDGPPDSRDRVISGHRDTHFRFLRVVQPGDLLRLTTADAERWYRVVHTEVVDSRWQQLVLDPGTERLSLVTCYPFDSPLAGGPLRYVVTALPATGDFRTRRSPSSG
jgi:sortase A